MASYLIFGTIVVGVRLIMFAPVVGFRKPDKKGIEQLGKALSKTKDDPIEPARLVP